MEEDFNNTHDDIDNFLNDIWSNADLNPPDPDGKRIDIHMSTGEHQLNSQTVRNMNRENFAVKEETVAEGSNLCTRVTIQSANQSARGPIGENIVVKEETDTEKCNLHVVVSNQNADQSATGTSCKNFVRKQEIVAGGNNNTQSATGGPSRSMVDRAGIRWRRMLKNRASAARSRARSLVRLRGLESEVKQYKEENARLRQKKMASEQGNEQAPPRAGRKVRCCRSCCW